MASRRYDAQKTKQELAMIAKELFIKKGYLATSIGDICCASGVSKGSLYYHFQSKEILFLYIVEENAQDWISKWQKKSNQYTNAIDKMYGFTEFYVEDFRNPFLQASEEFSVNELGKKEVIEQVLGVKKKTFQIFEQIIQQGIHEGEFVSVDVSLLTRTYRALLEGLSLSFYEMSIEEMKDLYRNAITLFLEGIAKKK
ncbi:transcriptional regulator, TetR family [Thermoactinomyces sp. DSM 45891]|uniref:TetR/AcrR family transcriptional regulator n=1 Tax=Thermoactinomyces sp. DSM 45891 TaxID=1761907 RepID=UPI000919C087|nr:TetR/AcrR family transcriptional regulator [Thermoactinomyces sp. DSM 45891]SFX69625.1 transcriptional regulator, TetR family [Thermoactinomyces sp. DSM 45891]